MDGSQLGAVLGIAIAGVIAAVLLRRAWFERSAARVWMILAGWAVIAIALLAGAVMLGTARGIFIASSLIPLSALAFIAAGVEVRPQRAALDKASIALEPSDRPSRAWRGVLRFLLAGPIGGLAAAGVGVMWTVFIPGDPQTRIVSAGLIIPFTWGALMAWTLSDDRIIRATAVLLGIAIVTFTAAYLRGFA